MTNVSQAEDISGMIDRARRASSRRDWLEAGRCWDAVRACSPQHVPAYLGAAHALRESGRYDEAELVLAEAADRFPADEQVALTRAWLSNARRDWPTAIRRWEDVCTRFPENPWCYVGHANALREAGIADRVESLLNRASETVLTATQQRGLDTAAAHRVQFEIAKARHDWPAAREWAEKIVASEVAPQANMLVALAQACWHLGDGEGADGAALRALSVDPASSDAVIVRAWVATERGDAETALSCYRRLAELNPGVARWSLKLVQLLNRFGRVREALSELENVRNRWPNDAMVRTFLTNYGPASAVPLRPLKSEQAGKGVPELASHQELQRIIDKAPAEMHRLRPLLADDPEAEVQIARVVDAESAVLVFCGSNDAVAMPLAIFDRFLSTLELSAVYLKDFRRLRFLKGIESLGSDYPGTVEALRGIITRLGVKRLCTMGNCDGGFAAIRYGVELGADRIVTFSSPTHSPPESLTKIEQARNFMTKRLAANVPQELMDLKPFLESRWNGTRIELFYEAENARDRLHALHLGALSGVTLHPQEGVDPDHRLLRQIALRSDDFRAWLGDLLEIETARRLVPGADAT